MSTLDVNELKPGTEFGRVGCWYTTIDSIIEQKNEVYLVKCHEDDGFIKYAIFEKENDHYHTSSSSPDLDAARHQFNLTVNYNNCVNNFNR